jgi:hypothetical protein
MSPPLTGGGVGSYKYLIPLKTLGFILWVAAQTVEDKPKLTLPLPLPRRGADRG